MAAFTSTSEIEAACRTLSVGDDTAAAAAARRQDQLTKPQRSLGRLEEFAIWLARWQGRPIPVLDKVLVLVFAGSHGITAHGVSAFPGEVTAQMVANFAAGGAAINQLARAAGAELRIVALDVERPTADFTKEPAMSEAEFVAAVSAGYDAAADGTDLLCVGEMGIGNTTAAAAVAAGLFGGGAEWAGRGTGVDEAGLHRKRTVVAAGLACHRARLGKPLEVLRRLGGRELAAMFGAVLAARHKGAAVLLDGFVSTAAAAPLALLHPKGLAHAQAAHRSAEAAHGRLLERLDLRPILDLDMRLGEASGACLAVTILRSALACHAGMATFAGAGISQK